MVLVIQVHLWTQSHSALTLFNVCIHPRVVLHYWAWPLALHCCVDLAGWLSEPVSHCVCERGKGRERQRKERVRQAPTRAPAPYMHPIHSYLVPVTRWLQNGIDYWFPPYHRSVVLAGYSELSESLAWDNKRRGRNTRRKYTHFKTHSTYTLLLTEAL